MAAMSNTSTPVPATIQKTADTTFLIFNLTAIYCYRPHGPVFFLRPAQRPSGPSDGYNECPGRRNSRSQWAFQQLPEGFDQHINIACAGRDQQLRLVAPFSRF